MHVVVKQVPLSLAWAVTLHAAQGSTSTDPVNVDHTKRTQVDGKWVAEPGGAYVARAGLT